MLILSGFRQCSGAPYLPCYESILFLPNESVNSWKQVLQFYLCRTAIRRNLFILLEECNLQPYQHHLQKSTSQPALKGIGEHVGQPY